MQLENEVYQYIRQMIDEDASRLEIVESCISEFGDEYPDVVYNDWSKLVKSLMPNKEETEEDIYPTIMPLRVYGVNDIYKKALTKLLQMVDWAEKTPIPLEKWTVNGVSKWLKQYKECLDLCKCIELDHIENSIDESLYNDISDAISKLEEYTSLLPKIEVLNESYIDKGAFINFYRRRNIRVPDNCSRKDKYLTLVSSITPITSSEFKKLVKHYHKGEKSALDAIVESYLPLIYKIAEEFHTVYPSIDIQDYIGEGVLAFCKALGNDKTMSSYGIMSYAISGVKQAMYVYTARYQTMIKIPTNVQYQIDNIRKIGESFMHRFGNEPSAEELAKEMDLPIDRIHELHKVPNSCVSIDAPYEEGKNYSLSDVLVDDDILSADGWLINESLSIEVDRALQTLTPREAYLLRKFLGIGTPEKTLEEMANEFQLTHARVRQIKEKAIRKLNQGQRSHILMTYLGGILPSVGELSVYAKQKELDKQEHLVLQNAITSADKPVNKQVDIQKDTPMNEKWIVELETEMGCLSQWLRKNNRTSVDEIIRSWSDIKFLYTYFEQQGSLELTNKIKLEYDRLCYDIKLMRHRCELLKRLYINGDDYEVMAKELNLTLRELYIYLEKTKLITTQKCNVLLEWQYIIQYRPVIDVQTLDKLYIYKSYFQHIKRSYRNGENAPHKIILLLAILTLYKNPDQQKTILIEMSDDLILLFNQYWGRYVKSNTWKRDISMPWSHMSNEPFWHEGSDGSNVCYIDADLRDLLKYDEYRQILREVLREQLK